MIATLATDIACNTYGSEEIGRMIEPLLREAAAAEHYVLLPRQEQPVVMNTKGASASGKSTLRPLQKSLAGDIGVNWDEFSIATQTHGAGNHRSGRVLHRDRRTTLGDGYGWLRGRSGMSIDNLSCRSCLAGR